MVRVRHVLQRTIGRDVGRGEAAEHPVGDNVFDTTKFWNECEKDNGAGAGRFTEQYVEVTGKVRKVAPERGLIILETPSSTAGIYCSFPTSEKVASTKEGDLVRIQGVCKSRGKAGTDIGLDEGKLWKPKSK